MIPSTPHWAFSALHSEVLEERQAECAPCPRGQKVERLVGFFGLGSLGVDFQQLSTSSVSGVCTRVQRLLFLFFGEWGTWTRRSDKTWLRIEGIRLAPGY